MANRQPINHPFEPIFDAHSRVLVLGTMPSPASRETGFYYGHPRNRFWEVCATLFDEPLATTNERRRDQLIRHHIALWDVLASCEIEGASDASIAQPMPNDVTAITRVAPIEAVFCTGAKAAELYRRYCEQSVGMPCVKLPSTSAANAGCSFDALLEAYSALLPYAAESERPVLDVADVVALEQAIALNGTSLAELMDRAGCAAAHRVIRHFDWAATDEDAEGKQAVRVVVLCGNGNNGGDGWVIARELVEHGMQVTLVTLRAPHELKAQPAKDAACAIGPLLEDAGAAVLVAPDGEQVRAALADADAVVDAVLGTGFDGVSVKEPYASWIAMANARHENGAYALAVDVPSGLSAQTGIRADACFQADDTVTMIVRKPGLIAAGSAEYVGKLHVAPLCSIDSLLEADGQW